MWSRLHARVSRWSLARCAVAWLVLVAVAGCDGGREAGLQELVNRGYSLSLEEFGRAAEAGDIEALRLFLQAGVRADAVDEAGNTAWLRAVSAGSDSSAAWLWDHGGVGKEVPLDAWKAGIESRSVATLRLLLERSGLPMPAELVIQAVRSGWLDGMELLLEQCGAEDDLGPAFLESVRLRTLEMASLLIQAGASSNSVDDSTGRTGLMIAAKQGDAPMVRFLLANGADRLATDHDHRMAKDHAQESGATPVVELLRGP